MTQARDTDNTLENQSVGAGSKDMPIVYPPLLTRSIVVFSLMLATFLIALDMSIIGTAVPMITTEFNSTADIGWYGSAFFLTLATFISPWGKAYKYFSLRIVYVTAIFIFEIGSLLCSVSQNNITLIIGRAIQGAGAAGLAGGGYTITAFIVPPSAQPVVVGLMGSVFTVASIAGPLLGGVFTSDVSWRWCFYINLPIGGITIICILLFFRTPAHSKLSHGASAREIIASFDPIGLVLMFSGVLCFFIAVQQGGVSKPWNSAEEIGLLVGCVLLLTLFSINEWYQGDRALIVYRILGTRSIGACSGFIFFLNAGNIALQYNLPIYFQSIQGNSAVESGIKMIPSILATALSTGIGSAAIGKLQIFQPFLLVGAAVATIGVGLIYTFDIDVGLGPIIGYQILYGVGTGLGVQTPNLVATITSRAEDVSIAVATVSFFMFTAGGWGVAVADAILNNLLLQKLPHYVPDIDSQSVLRVGAGGIKNAYQGEELRGVQQAYLDGLHGSWALGIAAFGVTFLWALVPRWPGRLLPPSGTKCDTQINERDMSDQSVGKVN
ncbi:Putative HC-toxin efflux carrier TOXA [Talaromyces islandicus]|uniref:Putative HC-toxin efflux carrier TOXA n=1 Tax=Talaromyces islandicus TaxID=28573 RepID=A0A0U1LKL9_TALIS|nr:Putative HC-toxin efflux carrier TOXA [Talaromyces islandicus]